MLECVKEKMRGVELFIGRVVRYSFMYRSILLNLIKSDVFPVRI